jgi:hypothetical protein
LIIRPGHLRIDRLHPFSRILSQWRSSSGIDIFESHSLSYKNPVSSTGKGSKFREVNAKCTPRRTNKLVVLLTRSFRNANIKQKNKQIVKVLQAINTTTWLMTCTLLEQNLVLISKVRHEIKKAMFKKTWWEGL